MKSLIAAVGLLFWVGCATTSSATKPAWESRLPSMTAVVEAAHAQPWGAELSQIPATVIDVGDLKGVPYFSYGAADVELNVYGDPEHPAGFEIGTKNTSPEFRAQLRAFVAGLLAAGDRSALDAVTEGPRVDKGSIAYEIAPPTAPDAYGAWWVTVTHPAGLDASRATVEELKTLVESGDSVDDAGPAFKFAVPYVKRQGFRPTGPRVYRRNYTRSADSYSRPERMPR